MRVLVNASTCVVGGGVQVASCFVNHLNSHRNICTRDWIFALSEQVVRECDADFLDELRAENRLVITSVSPGSLIKGWKTRRALAKACDSHRCDRVFTVFGPSYVNFGVPEHMGFADAFAFSPTDEAYTWHPATSRLFGRLGKALKIHFAAGAQRYWVEAPFARTALARALGIHEDRVVVIPNSLNTRILTQITSARRPATPTFFFLAAGYWHKNHMILPEVLHELRAMRPGIKLLVVLTLPRGGTLWKMLCDKLEQFGVSGMVKNAGPMQLSQVAEQLGTSTVVMQISLLETFSSTYLEAMASGVPLLVSDRSYARDICGGAALYTNPLDAIDISTKMLALIDNADLRHRLSLEGLRQVTKFPTAEEKNEKLYEFCTK